MRSVVVSLVLTIAPLGACAVGAVEPRDDVPQQDAATIQLDSGPTCRGNNDGVISRDEVIFAPGVQVHYRVNAASTVVPVNPHGTARMDGSFAWDFSSPDGDVLTLQAEAVSNQWFAAHYPGAQYVAPVDLRSGLVGIYRASETTVDLLGIAGAAMSDGTELRYDTAIPLLRFPLALGTSWSADAMTVDSTVNHTTVASRDHYDIVVDAAGELNLGILTFRKTLRLRVELTQRLPAGPGNRTIQYLWLTECYGEVARITSTNGEVDPDFTMGTEFRRLALQP